MSSNVLGMVIEYTPSCVDEETIDRLWAYLASKPEGFHFDCQLCGAERRAWVIDPGTLMLWDFTCADVKERCKTPPSPKAHRRPIMYRRGGLVLAPIDGRESSPWPGIIEDCPYGTERYWIQGKGRTCDVQAYHVTFIFPQRENRWVGGFIRASEVNPLRQPISRQPGVGPRTAQYKRALARALDALPLSMKERLLMFSFVAHVARLKNIVLDTGVTSCLKESNADEKRTEEGQSSQQLPRLSSESPKPREPIDGASGKFYASTSSETELGNVGPYLVRKITLQRQSKADSDSD